MKGYEISPDTYVTITPEELEAIAPKASRLIEIEEFVDLDEIDPLFYESSYYLVPDKTARKAVRAAARGDDEREQGRASAASCCARRST